MRPHRSVEVALSGSLRLDYRPLFVNPVVNSRANLTVQGTRLPTLGRSYFVSFMTAPKDTSCKVGLWQGSPLPLQMLDCGLRNGLAAGTLNAQPTLRTL